MPTYKQPQKVAAVAAGKEMPFNKKPDWKPLEGVSMTMNNDVKTNGIKIRGTGAATKGVMARGPMA